MFWFLFSQPHVRSMGIEDKKNLTPTQPVSIGKISCGCCVTWFKSETTTIGIGVQTRDEKNDRLEVCEGFWSFLSLPTRKTRTSQGGCRSFFRRVCFGVFMLGTFHFRIQAILHFVFGIVLVLSCFVSIFHSLHFCFALLSTHFVASMFMFCVLKSTLFFDSVKFPERHWMRVTTNR